MHANDLHARRTKTIRRDTSQRADNSQAADKPPINAHNSHQRYIEPAKFTMRAKEHTHTRAQT